MKRKTENAPAFLGLDCGGTRSVVIYEWGKVRRRAEGGSGNVGLLSDAQLVELFRELSRVHRNSPPPTAVAAGMAGAGIEAQRERIRRAAAKVWPGTPCLATGDLETALAAAEIEGRAGENGLAAVVRGAGMQLKGRAGSRTPRNTTRAWGLRMTSGCKRSAKNAKSRSYHARDRGWTLQSRLTLASPSKEGRMGVACSRPG
jgi:hypothetical protein